MSADWDVAVVGAGAAGLTAARVAAQRGLRVVAYERLAAGGQLVNLSTLHDHSGGTGPALTASLTADAEAAGVRLEYAEVTRVQLGPPARLTTSAGEVTARVVVVAAGLSPGRLGLPGEAELTGRGLSTCAACDGPLFRGRPVAVVGDDEWTATEALELAGHASAVTVLAPGEPRWSAARDRALAAAERVEVLTGAAVTALRGEGVLSGVAVRTADGEREMAVAGVFPFVGRRGPEALVDGLAADADGRLVPSAGVLVAGDARSGAERTLAAAEADGRAAGEAAVAVLAAGAGSLQVVDPTHGVLPEPAGADAVAASTAAWTDVALFTNSKPNATELLRGLGERLQAHWALPELGLAAKESASVAADPDQIDWLAQRFKVVLVAVGD
ncbi:NAD(P)/FAD-dependent oxidoreductase [Geodermatophilus sp. DSM 44513]|uniref:NAD(P)/FAD-dependent oxidoreductase n=1 Tax=Geodermatophilus sp. DSM 44513 TaxID=1528104 RepID=UPI0012840AD3|nr:NAD(P)/FAD-dependent oxidoreductase [Geodermatophilus sp. DSM 44513]WNV74151.1 NAD(P)/FAD-dependent oxidoreductase [Geodermatophilus sp. DSM 44513]